MTIGESLEIIQSFLEKIKQEVDVVCSFSVNGKIKNIVYNSVTKTLTEPLPDKTDNNTILLIPYLDSKSIKIKINRL